MWGLGAESVEIEGLAAETPTERVLARSKIVPEFLAGTRFSSVNIQAEFIPQAEAGIKKAAIYIWGPANGNIMITAWPIPAMISKTSKALISVILLSKKFAKRYEQN